MILSYCGATEKGVRGNNEDAYIILKHKYLYLFVVADGLGGHAAGELASNIAVTVLSGTVKRTIEDISLESMKRLLASGFMKANEEVCRQAKVVPERLGMGTTLVAALLNEEGRGIIANVGDSRAYLIGNDIKRISKDHSYVQELVDRGIITPKEADVHPEKNIVTRIIGMEGIEPDFYEVELGENTLLLCSDGLTDALTDETIREVVISSKMENTCRNFVDVAKTKSRDNITVIAAKREYGPAFSE